MTLQIKQAKKYFDLIANIYDEVTKKDNAWNPPNLISEYIKDYISEESILLDIGIGTGESLEKIYNNNKYKKIFGVDISGEMLLKCKEKFPRIITKEISNISDIIKLSDKFDLILASGVVEFIDDIEDLFNVVKISLNNNGYFIFTFEPVIQFHFYQQYKKTLTIPNKNSKVYVEDFYTYRYTLLEMKEYLNKFNFDIINDIEFIAYKKGKEEIIYHLLIVKQKSSSLL
jgi:predicted TPR repeat methyltransferase